MRKAFIYVEGMRAATFTMHNIQSFELVYEDNYEGRPISLTYPVKKKKFVFNQFPTFFEGLLPEGIMLETLLQRSKIDRHDYYSQLMVVGSDLVGNVTVVEIAL